MAALLLGGGGLHPDLSQPRALHRPMVVREGNNTLPPLLLSAHPLNFLAPRRLIPRIEAGLSRTSDRIGEDEATGVAVRGPVAQARPPAAPSEVQIWGLEAPQGSRYCRGHRYIAVLATIEEGGQYRGGHRPSPAICWLTPTLLQNEGPPEIRRALKLCTPGGRRLPLPSPGIVRRLLRPRPPDIRPRWEKENSTAMRIEAEHCKRLKS